MQNHHHTSGWLDRDAIIHLVIKAMRGIGASECEIEGFKDDIKNADHDTMLAKAINWGAPVTVTTAITMTSAAMLCEGRRWQHECSENS